MSSNSNEILKYVLSNENQDLSIRNIAHQLNKDYKNIYNLIKKLSKENIIKIEKIGNSNIIKPLKNPNPYFFQAEYSRREDILKNSKIKNIFNLLSKFYFPRIVLLFGSYGKNIYNKHSDIDLMIISEEKYHENIDRKIKILPYDIHPVFLDFEEFKQSATKKEFNVVNEAIKQNIILNGIEDYYQLIKNIDK
ncbi:nucleotidyltransferase domain protein [Methanobrevibacter cuticularis]|uniref:protein adenylyltransferase n=1 Tax=Methanobrevibacter cuticularis TaxID=47311 RepID=A0A166D0B4_9EURY|nr:nucleotidyltransferase domain-containing protein [Methanobrevibacter cuticularis]KZX15065.1 nucleotidyltransferase domain protein [Methanobrevibacter cuticularis]